MRSLESQVEARERAEALEVLTVLVDEVDWTLAPGAEERIRTKIKNRSRRRRWWDEHVAHWFY